jgi:hypothetical protein
MKTRLPKFSSAVLLFGIPALIVSASFSKTPTTAVTPGSLQRMVTGTVSLS